jgi:hypothetical protein
MTWNDVDTVVVSPMTLIKIINKSRTTETTKYILIKDKVVPVFN